MTNNRLTEHRLSAVTLTLAAIVGCVWLFVAFDLQRVKDEIFTNANKDLKNLTLAFAGDVASKIKTIDATLFDLKESWTGNADQFSGAVRKRQSFLANDLAFQVSIIDSNGKLIYSSLGLPDKSIDLSDREHFRVHRERTTDELFISKPVFGRVSQKWSIQFTRPIYKENSFSGVLVLSVSPEFFYRFYTLLDLKPDSVISVLKKDGQVLSHYPQTEEALGKSITNAPFLSQFVSQAGIFRAKSEIDGVDRILSWRSLDRHGIVVVTGDAVDQILIEYQPMRVRGVLSALGVTLLLAAVGVQQARSNRLRSQMEQELRYNEERWRMALDAVGDGVWDLDLSAQRVSFSPGWKRMLGYDPEEIGTSLDEWELRVHPDDLQQAKVDISNHIGGKTPVYVNEHRMRCKDGRWKWILDRGMVVGKDERGVATRMLGTHADISERKFIEEQLEALASRDFLTGLNNRRVFVERMEEELARIKRYPDQTPCALLMLDLDHFKRINDSFGHSAGDEVLIHFSELLKSTLRDIDVCGRLGGEEFGILLPNTPESPALELANRLCAIVRESRLDIRGSMLSFTVSIGVTVLQSSDTSTEHAMMRADAALYRAKTGGRDRVFSDRLINVSS